MTLCNKEYPEIMIYDIFCLYLKDNFFLPFYHFFKMYYRILIHQKNFTMKSLLPFVAIVFFACKGNPEAENINMIGTYKIVSNSVKSDTEDTTYTNRNQLKIYTDEYMMYANWNSDDSISGFGIGSYGINHDTLIENVVYSARDTMIYDAESSFILTIEQTPTGYVQTIPEMTTARGSKYTLKEDYERVGTGAKSSLDGAWRLDKRMEITGTDTVNIEQTQYKAFWSGYFIWGNTYTDSLGKKRTGIGYGTFEMVGPDKLKENMMSSTFAEVRGQAFDINIDMNGPDVYIQTINHPSGTKSVESYVRLKK